MSGAEARVRSATLTERDLAVFWHPAAQMADYHAVPPPVIVAAEGCRLRTQDGRELLDGISSWWCKALGHRHPRLLAALAEQAGRFEHVIAAGTIQAPSVVLCERLLEVANAGTGWFAKVLLADNGSTGVEMAVKLALHLQARLGRHRRTALASFAGGYHGETAATLALGDCAHYVGATAPLLFPVTRLSGLPGRSGPEDPGWLDASDAWPGIVAQLEPLADTLAAIVYEPVMQGAGGLRFHSPDLLRRLRAWADAHEVLLIADEIAAGLGRLGAPLASHLAPAALPDLAVVSKTLTGGVMSLAAVLCRQSAYDACLGRAGDGSAFLHSNTYTGNALACAVAAEALAVITDEGLIARAADLGTALRRQWRQRAAGHPGVADVRGCGLAVGLTLRHPDGTPLDPATRPGWAVCRRALDLGLMIRPLGDTIYLMPPLTISHKDLSQMTELVFAAVANG